MLALLDRGGQARPGWPIAVKDSTSCGLLLPVGDGSVRIVCNATDLPQPDDDRADVRAFAFDAGGRPLTGWPVQLRLGWPAGYVGAVVGDELIYFTEQRVALNPNTVSYEAWVTRVAVNGATRSGVKVQREETACCGERWAVGPDSVVYGSVLALGENLSAPSSSKLLAVSSAGVPGGFPIAIDGMASEPSFDADGRIHVTVVKEAGGPARTLVFDTGGQAAIGGSAELGINATDVCSGIEGSCAVPAAPLVGSDGTTFVIEAHYTHTKVAGLSPSGQMMAGWPYRSEAGVQGIGVCAPGDICEGGDVATAALGPGDVVYLINRANDEAVDGGSLVAVGPDGRVRAGWPVELKRAGAAFWSVVVGSDGTAYALAIEPESGGKSSASILAIAPDSTVRYSTTIVEP
ncbi:MAG: hypothetical protein A2Z32_04155 [Chloroflexi bacterium RBG_16_69_14]|nr:MAG: hypothetical protein A2Z32_04155 [Chloroflexi bacterium RBG_16_69_14]